MYRWTSATPSSARWRSVTSSLPISGTNPAMIATSSSTAQPNTVSTAVRCGQPRRSSQLTSGTSRVARNRATITGTTMTLSWMSRYSTSPAAVSTTSSRQLQAARRRSAGGTSGRSWSLIGSSQVNSGQRRRSPGIAFAGPAKLATRGRPTLYQRDYLMRQIEQVGRMLAAIVGLAKGGRGDEALGMFDEAYKPLVGVGSRVVAVLDDAQLVDMLTSGSNPDMRRVALALELLKAEADLYAEAGQEGEAAIRYRRAVALAGTLAARSERLLDRDLAAGLLERAAELELSTAQRLAVARVL